MDWNKYINMSWSEQFHCIDFVNYVAKLEGFGWEINDGVNNYLEDCKNMERLERHLKRQNLIEITDYNQLQEKDLMVFRLGGIVHVGIYIGDNNVLQILPPWFGTGISEIANLNINDVFTIDNRDYNKMKRCFVKAYRKQ